MAEKYDVIVIGAGPAGLSSALRLGRQGKSVLVLEKEDHVGGLCATLSNGDSIFDLGGHRIISKDEEVMQEVLTIMGDELDIRNRKSQILLKGKFFEYPLDMKDLLKKMPLSTTMASGFSYIFTKIARLIFPHNDVSLKDWVTNRFGKKLYDIYFGPYTEKLWGMSPDEISADFSSQRISLISLTDVLLRMLKLKKGTPKTYASKFYYPKKGIGRLCERFADEVIANGGQVMLSSNVEKYHLEGNQLVGIEAGGKEYTANHFINTSPMPELLQKLDPIAPQDLIETSRRMRFRSLRFLCCTFNVPKFTDNNWIYISEPKYLFMRLQDLRNWSPHLVPEGKSALVLEISCARGDEIWDAPTETLLKRCMEDLEKIGISPGITDKLINYADTRNEHAYPVYDLDYKQRIRSVLGHLLQIENLTTCGRQGLYRYNNMDHSIKMGFLAAKRVAEGGPMDDILAIASEAAVFEGGSKFHKQDTRDYTIDTN
jgi:protoporphyrinogen oxidase